MKYALTVALCCCVAACNDGDSPAPSAQDSHPGSRPEVVLRHNEAVAAMGAFDYDAALEALDELAVTHPLWNDVQVDHAIAQLNRQAVGDDSKALLRLGEVLARDPSHVRAHFVAGILRLHAGDIAEAKHHFETVTSLDPLDAYAAYYLGQAMMQLGDIEASVPWFRLAIEVDPYLRSAYYAGAQAARRTGGTAQAAEWLDVFQRLEHNPRAHLAEIKYTRMGPKAEVRPLDGVVAKKSQRPSGDVFDVTDLEFAHSGDGGSLSIGWQSPRRAQCIISSDRGAAVRRFQFGDDESFTLSAPSLLDSAAGVSGALWGDVDADGVLDVVLARNGVNELWLGGFDGDAAPDEKFHRVSAASASESVDGALFDADHDGDLDVFFVNRGASHVLMNNNGDGTWREIIDASGFPGGGTDRNGRSVLVADFDGDLDQDILVIHEDAPHEAWVNDRLWNWRAADADWGQLLSADVIAAVAADIDGDGAVEVVTLGSDFGVGVWSRGADGWRGREVAPPVAVSPLAAAARRGEGSASIPRLAVADVTGDGALDIIADTGWERAGDGAPVLQVIGSDGGLLQTFAMPAPWTLLQRADGRGPGLLGVGQAGLVVAHPGSGRHPYVDAVLRGRTDPGQSMRSNASGIGSTLAARVGTRWTIHAGVRPSSGPGQSLQPVSIGLDGADDVDFISVDWTDGVFQTESHLKPGAIHEIVETQRQLSSCPLIFAWNGSEMGFVTDCLGVGGLGFLLAPDLVANSRPHERVLLPPEKMAPRGGRYEIILAEPMQETCYLDSVVLECIDLPSGWEVLPDERMGTSSPSPTSDLLFSRHSLYPVAARGGVSDRTMEEIRIVDGVAVDPGVVDSRFIGRVVDPNVLELDFKERIDLAEGQPMLVLDGWVEYPYSQTMFAAWQAGRSYAPLSIEARGHDGVWRMVHRDIGYPAGMPRRSVFPLLGLPEGANSIRLSCDLELYVDAARVAMAEPCDEAIIRRVNVDQAMLDSPGYPMRRDGAQRYPDFTWNDRKPFWDVRSQRGNYTEFGSVEDLIGQQDGSIAVFGAGEAIECGFPAPDSPASGRARHLVLDLHGWCKDMDLLTQGGDQVDPVPGELAPRRTRHRSGR